MNKNSFKNQVILTKRDGEELTVTITGLKDPVTDYQKAIISKDGSLCWCKFSHEGLEVISNLIHSQERQKILMGVKRERLFINSN